MKAEARKLDDLVREWCLKPAPDDSLFERIAECALTAAALTSLVPFARALRILDTRRHPSAVQARVEELRLRVRELIVRERQVDDLGDIDNEPQTVLDILGDDLDGFEGFDAGGLRQAKLSHQGSRALASRALLDTLGWANLSSGAVDALRIAIDDLEEREHNQAWGLFVDVGRNEGVALGLKLALRDSGQEVFWSEADPQMREQARIALRHALGNGGWEAKIEWPASYIGESLGLPLYVAALVAKGDLPRHSLIGSTGRVDVGGHVTGVSGIREKLGAARSIGIRKVLVPLEDMEEASAVGEDLIVVPVGHLGDVAGAFRQSISSIELGYAGLVRLIRASVQDYGLLIENEIESASALRFVLANAVARISIWIYKNGRVRADGPSGAALDAAIRLIAERVPPAPEQRTPFSFQLPTLDLQNRYQATLQRVGAVNEIQHENELWRMRLARGRSRATIMLYNSGKCVINGTAPAWNKAYEAAQEVTQGIGGLPKPQESADTPGEDAENPNEGSEPHIGTDEAGKGDYFGPLVSAAMYVDSETAARFRQLGVRDSKALSDRRVRELATKIRELAEGRYAVTPINPRKYNELREQFRREGKNLNSLLAWGHAKSIDRLLTAPSSRGIQAKYVVVDQFADKRWVEDRTKRFGIPVHQRHKAESDIAVAAASILARDAFLQWLERWSELTHLSLPKGASAHVIDAAKQYVRRWGAKWLGDVAKLSFRTTLQVLEGEDSNADSPPPPWTNEAADASREG